VDPAADTAMRVALALLFAAAAAHKARDLAAFRAAVAGYRLLPETATGFVAAALVAAEVALAAALALGPRAPAALAAPGLLALYAGAIAANLARGRRDIDCGCGGPALRQTLSTGLVVRNAALGCAALTGLAPLAPRALVWVDAWTIAGAVLALSALYTATNRLLAQSAALAASGSPR
jgi:hypothetical protein